MNNEQREQQAPQAPAPRQTPEPKADFAKKGTLAAIGGAFSGAARAVVAYLLRDAS